MKKAFTLAEVLITLTIIGVIAAITIPNLMQRYQEHVTVNKVKKFYSTLTNAYTQAVKEYGTADEWNFRGNDEGADKVYEILIKPYFKLAKNCNTIVNCGYSDKTKYKNGSNGWTYRASVDRPYILDDGSFFWISDYNIYTDANILINFVVNPVQKDKGAQVYGKNIFIFKIFGDKVYPAGLPGIAYDTRGVTSSFDSGCATSGSKGGGCAAWLIYKGNMDYLHCNDLTWNGKNKCSK